MSDEKETNTHYILLIVQEPVDAQKYAIVTLDQILGSHRRENIKVGRLVYAKFGDNEILKGNVLLINASLAYVRNEMRRLNKRDMEGPSFYTKKRRISEAMEMAKPVIEQAPITVALAVPPMTFDQQTQTDPKITGQNDDASVNTEACVEVTNIINIQKSLMVISEELTKTSESQQNQCAALEEEMQVIRALVDKINGRVVNISNRMKYQMEDVEVVNEVEAIESSSDVEIKFDANDVTTYADGSISGSKYRKLGITAYIPDGGRTIRQLIIDNHDDFENSDEMFVIGTNKTEVPKSVLFQINWDSHSIATRKLLTTLFTREVLATHSLTGKPSPAFMDRNKPRKNRLNEIIIADIVECVAKNCNVSDTAVRTVITTKCADENKMQRMRLKRYSDSIALNQTL